VAARSDLDGPNPGSCFRAVSRDDNQAVIERITEFGIECAHDAGRCLPAAENEDAVEISEFE
jgi:hypothetical protein